MSFEIKILHKDFDTLTNQIIEFLILKMNFIEIILFIFYRF